MPQIIITNVQKVGSSHEVSFTADFNLENLFYQTSLDNVNWNSPVTLNNFTSPITVNGITYGNFFIRLGTDYTETDARIYTSVYSPVYN